MYCQLATVAFKALKDIGNNVNKMENFESVTIRTYNINSTTIKIQTNMGILNDKVGSGKTITIVSLLSGQDLYTSSRNTQVAVKFCIK